MPVAVATQPASAVCGMADRNCQITDVLLLLDLLELLKLEPGQTQLSWGVCIIRSEVIDRVYRELENLYVT